MSVRAMIDQLTGAKHQLQQARLRASGVSNEVSAAKHAVDKVLDSVQDKQLSTDLAAHAQSIKDEAAGVERLFRGIDDAIRRAQGIRG